MEDLGEKERKGGKKVKDIWTWEEIKGGKGSFTWDRGRQSGSILYLLQRENPGHRHRDHAGVDKSLYPGLATRPVSLI